MFQYNILYYNIYEKISYLISMNVSNLIINMINEIITLKLTIYNKTTRKKHFVLVSFITKI
jgi:hypothetical protein